MVKGKMYANNVFDETLKFVNEVIKNKNKHICGITNKDSSSSHTPKHKTSEEQITKIISHITSFLKIMYNL